ncbi:MAG TPA: RNA-directed DNA polymerase [Patescibacteria group bacterium]|nr:RNA-directed DNA polymerase [Patescibacteria group bacterium]
MEMLTKLIDYKNLHLAYERTKNDLMNRELHSFNEQNAFESCIPFIYEDIRAILESPDNFEFQSMEILFKPKTWSESDGWDIRPLARLSFYDSVIIQCVMNIIAELISPLLSPYNYGYKLNGVESINMYEHWKNGYAKFTAAEIDVVKEDFPYNYSLEVDIQKFYPSISHSLLLKDIEPYIVKSEYRGNSELNKEDILIRWLKKILSISQVDAFGKNLESDGRGLPQGPLYSPIFALFYIRDCFKELKHYIERLRYFAYVDDFRFYCETEEQANTIKNEFVAFLEKLGLTTNEEKTNIFKIDTVKIAEADIMGRASNLGRAIRNDVILSSNGKNEMKENLRNLVGEVNTLYETLLRGNKDISKFKLRLEKFGLYRIIQLIETSDEWVNEVENLKNIGILTSNYIAMVHVLHTCAKTISQKQKLLEILETVICNPEYEELTYIKYVSLQYYFIWSPYEIKLSRKKVEISLQKFINTYTITETFLKGIMSKCHEDWHPLLINRISLLNINMDREMNTILFSIMTKHGQKMINVKCPNEYVNKAESKLEQSMMKLRFTAGCNSFIRDEQLKYLDDEELKNIYYFRFKEETKKSIKRPNWVIRIPHNLVSLQEYSNRIEYESKIYILRQIFEWLSVQLNYKSVSHKIIPCSVVNPEYIWIDENINNTKGKIILLGNPLLNNEIYYSKVPQYMWRESLIKLFECCFNLDIKNLKTEDLSQSIEFWQFRIISLLKDRSFNLEKFVYRCLEILRKLKFSDRLSVTSEHFRLLHLVNHYISDSYLHDRFIEITRFVESSWKNGSKECYFFTLHNHEHARFLIYVIHEFIEKTGFKIYFNQVEAFRIFTACFLHDIGMLSAPPETKLYSKDIPEEITKIFRELLQPMAEAAATVSPTNVEISSINKKRVFATSEYIEQLRMNIVRKTHHEISKNEILMDYPNLPLTTAERRDIAEICNAHGNKLTEVYSLEEKVFEGRSPVNLKLLSCLLRLSDLCDVSSMRISKEVLERNEERMGLESLFHWIKHMSVEKIEILCNDKDKSQVKINIYHNYLPWMYVEESTLKKACGDRCKKNTSIKYGSYNIPIVSCTLEEEESCIKYLDSDTCNLLCAFINKAYGWFYSEVVFINRYFKELGINLNIDLSILPSKNEMKLDFLFVENRNIQKSAQEFLVDYLLNA